MTITRSRLRELIGLDEPAVSLLSSKEEPADGYVIEHLRLRLGDTEVRGILTRPVDNERRLPAIRRCVRAGHAGRDPSAGGLARKSEDHRGRQRLA